MEEEIEKEIIKLYQNSNYSLWEIENILNVSKWKINDVIKTYGIKSRRQIQKDKALRIKETGLKKCTNCNEEKSIEKFNKNKTDLGYWCKDCIKDYNKRSSSARKKAQQKYYKENKEHITKQKKIYYEENKEHLAEQKKIYYEENKEHLSRYRKDWAHANKSSIAIKKKEYSQTPKGRFATYKANAKRRKIQFNISQDEFNSLWMRPCSYCGGDVKTIGLDRIDNSIGYVFQNIVSCCYTCNINKSSMSYKNWAEYIYQFINFNTFGIIKINNNIKAKTIRTQLQEYKYKANKRNIKFCLTLEEFSRFNNQPCEYCGTITKNKVGIDRVNNDIGYVIDNCVSCCKICNFGKNNKSLKEWKGYIDRLVSFNAPDYTNNFLYLPR